MDITKDLRRCSFILCIYVFILWNPISSVSGQAEGGGGRRNGNGNGANTEYEYNGYEDYDYGEYDECKSKLRYSPSFQKPWFEGPAKGFNIFIIFVQKDYQFIHRGVEHYTYNYILERVKVLQFFDPL